MNFTENLSIESRTERLIQAAAIDCVNRLVSKGRKSTPISLRPGLHLCYFTGHRARPILANDTLIGCHR